MSEDGLMPFGKHQGKHITELPSTYLQWLCANVQEKKYRDLVMAAEDELEERGEEVR